MSLRFYSHQTLFLEFDNKVTAFFCIMQKKPIKLLIKYAIFHPRFLIKSINLWYVKCYAIS